MNSAIVQEYYDFNVVWPWPEETGGMPIDEGGPRMWRPGTGPKQNWQIKYSCFIFIANL